MHLADLLAGPLDASTAGAAAASSSADGSSMPPTPTSCAAQTAISFNAFCGLLEEVLATRRGPRAYLAPSPGGYGSARRRPSCGC